MKISYHSDTDSLYVQLNASPTDQSEEVAPDFLLHFDESGEVAGLEILSGVSRKVDLAEVVCVKQ